MPNIKERVYIASFSQVAVPKDQQNRRDLFSGYTKNPQLPESIDFRDPKCIFMIFSDLSIYKTLDCQFMKIYLISFHAAFHKFLAKTTAHSRGMVQLLG